MKTVWTILFFALILGAIGYLLVTGGYLGGPDTPGTDLGRDGPVSRVEAIERAQDTPAGADSLEDLLVEMTSTSMQAFEKLMEAVEGPGDCRQQASRAREVIERARPRVVGLLERAGRVQRALPPEEAATQSRRALERLRPRLQAFNANQAQGLQALEAFHKRCPAQAHQLRKSMGELMRAMRAADPRR